MAAWLLLACLAGEGTAAEARISSVRWLESAAEELPESDAALIALAAGPGREVASPDAVPYAPFRARWLAFRLERSGGGGEEAFFRLNASQRREIDAFLIVGGRVVARAAGGYARVPPSEALVAPEFTLPLIAWTGPEARVLLRVIATERVPARAGLAGAEELRRTAVLYSGFLLLFTGCAVVFVLFQLFFYRSLRERASRDYALFIGLALLVYLIRPGWLSWDLRPGPASLYPGDFIVYLRAASLVAVLSALDSYLELAVWSAGLRRANRFAQALLVALLVGSVGFGPGIFQLTLSASYLPLVAWVLFVTGRAVRVRRPGAVLLMIAWAGLAAAALCFNLVIIGLLPAVPLIPFVPQLGMLWEMVLNGAGLTLKLDALRAQRHQAQVRQVEVLGLTRLVRVVCHDISNPLMTVQLALERLKLQLRAAAGPGELLASVGRAEQGAADIKGIIDDVRSLELLRQSGGRLPVQRADLAALAGEAVGMFREWAASKGVEIAAELPAPAPGYAVPGILVRSVISNVLSNAVKFTPAGARVSVGLVRAPGRVGLRITDAGPGIPADTVQALERGEPVASQLGSEGEPGTGFGLRLCRDFTVAMGGSMEFVVAGPGAGTAVTIWLRAA